MAYQSFVHLTMSDGNVRYKKQLSSISVIVKGGGDLKPSRGPIIHMEKL